MGYFLFIDESGQDRQASPHEVLAGIAVQDSELWNLVQRTHTLEQDVFGMRISEGKLELKGKKLLKRKTFRLAGQVESLAAPESRELVCSCLKKGQSEDPAVRKSVSRLELSALGQAKIAFVSGLLELCSQHRVRAFASIVNNTAERPQGGIFCAKTMPFCLNGFFTTWRTGRQDLWGSLFLTSWKNPAAISWSTRWRPIF